MPGAKFRVKRGERDRKEGEVNNSESSPTDRLKTEEVNLSDSGAENSSLAGNYRLEALDVELKVPSYELPLNKDRYLQLWKLFR